MPQIDANAIKLEYEVSGDPAGPPMLLIMGLGAQLTRWPEAFHRALADAGFRVIRYDNRDVGKSTRMVQAASPSLPRALLRSALGAPVRAPYDLGTLTADAIGLLDALGIRSAHIVGASMGGMIAQMLAAHHANRVRSLVSIMSSSGHRRLPQPSLGVRLALVSRPGSRASRAEIIDATVARYKRLASPGYPPDEQLMRDLVTIDYDRGYYPPGTARQLLAILASGSRTPILGRITAPTLIQHGADDPLIPVAAAYDLHHRIPGSRLEIFPGMGHDLPRGLVATLTGQIIDHVRRADVASAAQASGAAVS
ncbi:MAG TPA: alpha/beta fold hydrolase [Kofleriaceae bacterium]|jgi:pimeloyl-ACP methyl ester carboxylesterase|nr:alpha/beta fold hydrolase [Kofleriaceae bacterium]